MSGSVCKAVCVRRGVSGSVCKAVCVSGSVCQTGCVPQCVSCFIYISSNVCTAGYFLGLCSSRLFNHRTSNLYITLTSHDEQTAPRKYPAEETYTVGTVQLSNCELLIFGIA